MDPDRAIDPACLRYGSFDPGPEIRLTIFSDAPWMASVVAETSSSLLTLEKDQFKTFKTSAGIKKTIFSDAPLILLFPNAIALKNFTLSLS